MSSFYSLCPHYSGLKLLTKIVVHTHRRQLLRLTKLIPRPQSTGNLQYITNTWAPPALLTDRTVCHYTSSFLLKCTAQFTSPLPHGVIMRNDMLMVCWYTADACAISNHSLSAEVKYLQVSSLKAPKLISQLKLKKKKKSVRETCNKVFAVTVFV